VTIPTASILKGLQALICERAIGVAKRRWRFKSGKLMKVFGMINMTQASNCIVDVLEIHCGVVCLQ
jgi:hypothetical protein